MSNTLDKNAGESKGTALITGASGGIGAVYADRLARRGYDLILVARSADKLGEVAQRIANDSGRSVRTIVADLNNAEDLGKVEAVLRSDGEITALVNNAGVGAASKLLDSDIETMAALIDLNIVALTRLTYAVVPKLVARGGGTIINIASIAGIAPELLNGVYGASKAYVLTLSESLNHELADKHIRVQAVLPGATATDFWNIIDGVGNLPQQIVMSTEDMVDAALAGLDLGERVTIPSLPDAADWNAFENARRTLTPNLSLVQPAARYGVFGKSAA
jgi:short-subunit dehydrogenase